MAEIGFYECTEGLFETLREDFFCMSNMDMEYDEITEPLQKLGRRAIKGMSGFVGREVLKEKMRQLENKHFCSFHKFTWEDLRNGMLPEVELGDGLQWELYFDDPDFPSPLSWLWEPDEPASIPRAVMESCESLMYWTADSGFIYVLKSPWTCLGTAEREGFHPFDAVINCAEEGPTECYALPPEIIRNAEATEQELDTWKEQLGASA